MRASCCSKATIPLWTAAFLTILLALGLTQLYKDGVNASKPGSVPNTPNMTDRYISLDLAVVSVDIDGNSLILNWDIIYDSTCWYDPQPGLSCSDVDIFIPPNYVLTGSNTNAQPATNALPNTPTYRWNPIARSSNYTIRPSFQTRCALVTNGSINARLEIYPFDFYNPNITVFAMESTTNAAVGIEIRGPRSDVGWLHAKFVYHKQCAQYMLTISRSFTVVGYTFVIVIAIWLITLIFAFVAMSSIFMGYRQRIEVLLVPIATLFAFPQLRTTLPGVPEVSGFDYICFLPCLGILSLSAFLTITASVFLDTTKAREPLLNKILWRSNKADPPMVSLGSTWF
ncbi:hypothetical protein PILCRDRAFT_823560 [Piloderma croceum F 1598]|uniref:Uncharacterized protein n=1 Tax=Piloderma croceum (strain F 1598) TaxID=765440 RepID=A0A0C3FI61_PILCF|nr:hypothetical protein PILCRDRAFT_823560 [Piloderma croceum F 1598]